MEPPIKTSIALTTYPGISRASKQTLTRQRQTQLAPRGEASLPNERFSNAITSNGMELRQLRSLVTLSEVQFSVTRTAKRLQLVQSAVTQHLKQLEAEVGTSLFVRHGKRLIGLTAVGEKVLGHACEVLRQTGNIVAVSREHRDGSRGILRLGATHLQARYVLPPIISEFADAYPDVEVQIHQGVPSQLVDLALRDLLDIVVCSESIGDQIALQGLPCFRWNRALVAPLAHPLLDLQVLTLTDLCSYPIVTYVRGVTGRDTFTETLNEEGLHPRIVLSAADTDVIKAHVRAGLGVGVIAAPGYQPAEDADLGVRDLSEMFPWGVTKIAHSREKYLLGFHQHFVDIFRANTSELAGHVQDDPHAIAEEANTRHPSMGGARG